MVTPHQINEVAIGHNTTDVLKKNKVPAEFDGLCFSIIAKDRTLDLKAESIDVRCKWVQYFKGRIIQVKEQIQKESRNKEFRYFFLSRASQIWQQEIYQNIDLYWNYQKREPHYINDLRAGKIQLKLNNQSMNDFWKNIFHQKTSQKQTEVTQEIDQLISKLNQNKNYLLINLSKLGSPDWVKQSLWELYIGNSLQISQKLYNILLQKISQFMRNSQAEQNDPVMMNSLKLMQKDISDIQQNQAFYKDNVLRREVSLSHAEG